MAFKGKQEPSAEVAITSEDRFLMAQDGDYGDVSFASLAQEATYTHMGFTLVGKSSLVGIPLIIVGLAYRAGIPANGRVGDYVSLEAVVGGPRDFERNIKLGILDPNTIGVGYNETVVFNDGSTGIRRQVAQLLHVKGMANVGPEPDEKEGLLNKFDRPYQFWMEDGFENCTITENSVEWQSEADGAKVRWLFRNGLRSSEYEWAPGQVAQTFYFA